MILVLPVYGIAVGMRSGLVLPVHGIAVNVINWDEIGAVYALCPSWGDCNHM